MAPLTDISNLITQRFDGQFDGKVPAGFDESGNPVYKSVYSYSYLAVRQKMKSFSSASHNDETVDFYVSE